MKSNILEKPTTERFRDIINAFIIIFGLGLGIFIGEKINDKIIIENQVDNYIQQFTQLGVDLNQPVACNSKSLADYSKAKVLYSVIASYVPYTLQPKQYRIFLNSIKPISLQVPCKNITEN